jgi:DNA-directed RNA polymerase specialized sigma24 family protein
MPRPLTKRTEGGVPYTRPAAVERAIAQALTETPATLATRAAISDPRDPQFLALEVLVHLVRRSLRMQDWSTANAILERLGERVARSLERKVRETNAFDAHFVREESLSRLFELFAEDQRYPPSAVLDFFEVRFNRAFAALRTAVIREAIAVNAPLEPMPETVEVTDDEDGLVPELADLSNDADVVLSAEREQLYRLIQRLPLEERQVIVYKYLGLKTESNDPTEITVATRCGVSGSEVRSRLRAAYAHLKKWMED